jgi:PD-(D/E)XK nuclease superfamily protein
MSAVQQQFGGLVAEVRDGKPYIWPTWITGLISGEKHCQWAAWFKAHYHYTKRVDENERQLDKWSVDHTEMLKAEADRLRAIRGMTVRLEEQNKFSYRGKVAVVGGKPDIAAYQDNSELIETFDTVTIVDCKSGRDRISDFVQVCIYMLLAPSQIEAMRDRIVDGCIVYRNRPNRVITMREAEAMRESITNQIRRTAAEFVPPRTPSESECRYCDILGCPERATQTLDVEPEEGDAF